VLIVGPAHVTLIDGSTRREFEQLSKPYQDLKAMSHLALGMHALFFDAPGDRAKLDELRAAAARAVESLQGFTPEQMDRQRELVRLAQSVNGPADVPAYERAAAPLLLANALDAARDEIAHFDAAAAQISPGQWKRLHVIVVGAHMAREGEIAMQYFGRKLGEPEGLRLIFAEGVWDEPGQLQLLGTHLIDASVGEGFFGDPLRMHRDLLSDGAAQVLKQRESPSGR
jgi:hypothetical protein